MRVLQKRRMELHIYFGTKILKSILTRCLEKVHGKCGSWEDYAWISVFFTLPTNFSFHFPQKCLWRALAFPRLLDLPRTRSLSSPELQAHCLEHSTSFTQALLTEWMSKDEISSMKVFFLKTLLVKLCQYLLMLLSLYVFYNKNKENGTWQLWIMI